MVPLVRKKRQMHVRPVDVVARAIADPEPKHLRERHEVPLLEVEGAAAGVVV